MRWPTKERFAFGATTFIVHILVCVFAILPLLHDMENWALWKYALLFVVFMFVAHAVTELVAWTWEFVAYVITTWRRSG